MKYKLSLLLTLALISSISFASSLKTPQVLTHKPFFDNIAVFELPKKFNFNSSYNDVLMYRHEFSSSKTSNQPDEMISLTAYPSTIDITTVELIKDSYVQSFEDMCEENLFSKQEIKDSKINSYTSNTTILSCGKIKDSPYNNYSVISVIKSFTDGDFEYVFSWTKFSPSNPELKAENLSDKELPLNSLKICKNNLKDKSFFKKCFKQ